MSIPYPFRDGDLPTGPPMFFGPAPANPPTLVSLAGAGDREVSAITKQRLYALVGGLVSYQLSSRQTPRVNRLLLGAIGGVAGSLLALRLAERAPQDALGEPPLILREGSLGRPATQPPASIRRGSIADARLVAAQGLKLAGKAGGDLVTIATSRSAPWSGQRTVPGVLRAARAALTGTPGDQYVAKMALKYAIEHEGYRSTPSAPAPAPSSVADMAPPTRNLRQKAIIRTALGLGWLALLGLTVRAVRKRRD